MPDPRPDTAERFRRTRAAHDDEINEDYVEAVAELIETRGEARVRDLAVMMGVSHVTVTRRVAKLKDAGFVGSEPRRPVTLTTAGKRLAERSQQRHEVVLAFLRSIGVPKRQAEIDAEGIEHHVSDATVKAMRRAMGDN